MMILSLLLSSVVAVGAGEVAEKEKLFQEFVTEAAHHHWLPAPKIAYEKEQVIEDAGAWVLICYSFDCPNVVYVHHPSLEVANRWWERYMAYHEVCHIKLGHTRPGADVSKRGMAKGEAAARKCTEETMDRLFSGGWELFSKSYPCDYPIPTHVMNDWKKRGKTCAP
jgi:hypothetical protein